MNDNDFGSEIGAEDKQDLHQCLGTISSAIVGYMTKKVTQINSIAQGINNKLDDIDKKFENIPNDGDFRQIADDIEKTIVDKINDTNFDSQFSELGSAIDDKFSDVHTNIDSTRNAINGKIDAEINDVRADINNLSTTLGGTLVAISRTVAEILSLQKNVATKLEETESQLADKQTEIESIKAQLNKAEIELQQAKGRISSLEKEIGEKSGELNAANRERSSVEKSLGDWKSATEIYVPVRDTMLNCPTFRNFLEQRGLTDDSEIGLFAFVQELGKTIDFLSEVHSVALAAKKNNPQPMTHEEIEVYDALNHCYRSIWEIDFDVFTTPGSRKSIAEPFMKTPFVKEEASYLKDPRNRNWKFTKNIYVPLLLTRDGKPYKQAQVDASSM